MSAFDIIIKSCDSARKDDIKLVRGSTFDWCRPLEPHVPLTCNALGAVLWCKNKERTDKAWTALKAILDVDEFWLYRWCIGWDAQHQLIYYTEKDGKLITHQDEVSKFAKALYKRYASQRTGPSAHTTSTP